MQTSSFVRSLVLRGALLAGWLLIAVTGRGAPAESAGGAALAWRAVPPAWVEGKGWLETAQPYDRLPAKAQAMLAPPLWQFSQHAAGLQIRFVSDAAEIRARWQLRNADRLALPHMAATAVSGLDLYVRDAGQWRFIGAGRPGKSEANEWVLVTGLKPGVPREYQLNLPLYNGVAAVELGLPAGASLEAAPARNAALKPIVFYGGSIVQGACASRPGMAYPAILGRALDWPVVNLGINANGKAEPEMAQLLGELDPAAYVIDGLANLDAAQVTEKMEGFLATLRAKHPDTPIVLVEEINYPSTSLVEERRLKVATSDAALRKLHDRLKAAGDAHLFYVPSEFLLGGDGEDTVDAMHPTDLGFLRIAHGMEPVLREAIGQTGPEAVDKGFESLFDGKTLSGWKHHDGMPPIHRGAKWWVEDGVLFGTQDPPGTGGLLWLDRPFRNFILKLQVQLTYPMDTGVFLRVGPTGLSHQVTLDYRPGSYVGAIFIPFVGHSYVYRNPEGASLVKEGWNDVEIRMEGDPARIRVWLNGRLVTDFQHTLETSRGLPPKGGIALQVHPDVEGMITWKPGSAVRYRNIRIKEL